MNQPAGNGMFTPPGEPPLFAPPPSIADDPRERLIKRLETDVDDWSSTATSRGVQAAIATGVAIICVIAFAIIGTMLLTDFRHRPTEQEYAIVTDELTDANRTINDLTYQNGELAIDNNKLMDMLACNAGEGLMAVDDGCPDADVTTGYPGIEPPATTIPVLELIFVVDTANVWARYIEGGSLGTIGLYSAECNQLTEELGGYLVTRDDTSNLEHLPEVWRPVFDAVWESIHVTEMFILPEGLSFLVESSPDNIRRDLLDIGEMADRMLVQDQPVC